jgi:(p)ppGpp synthase/HD superfamily hydrolase
VPLDAHKDQRRKSMRLLIFFHPIGVAKIVAQEIDLSSFAAALI